MAAKLHIILDKQHSQSLFYDVAPNSQNGMTISINQLKIGNHYSKNIV